MIIPSAADALVRIRLLPTDAGGRQGPTPDRWFGCIFAYQGEMYDCRLILEESGSLFPGSEAIVPIQFLNPGVVSYLRQGSRFELWEGKIIGEGEVVRIG
jgi:hypothetical protein